jgi:hypothetical protein
LVLAFIAPTCVRACAQICVADATSAVRPSGWLDVELTLELLDVFEPPQPEKARAATASAAAASLEHDILVSSE